MDDATRDDLIAALATLREVSQAIADQTAPLLADDTVWSAAKAQSVIGQMDAFHEAERIYHECLRAAGWEVPHQP